MSFTARFRAQCTATTCDRAIAPGDAVVYVDQKLTHDECALDGGLVQPAERSICRGCFTEVSISGACAC